MGLGEIGLQSQCFLKIRSGILPLAECRTSQAEVKGKSRRGWIQADGVGKRCRRQFVTAGLEGQHAQKMMRLGQAWRRLNDLAVKVFRVLKVASLVMVLGQGKCVFNLRHNPDLSPQHCHGNGGLPTIQQVSPRIHHH